MISDDIVTKYSNLIYSIANKFYGVNKEDLYQAGFLGLVRAYKNFDSSKCVKFSTYAVKYIYGEMYNLCSNNNIKVSRDLLKLYKDVEEVKYKLCQLYNRIPTIEEISKYLDCSVSDIESISYLSNMIISLDSDEFDVDMYNYVGVDERENVDNKIYVNELLDILDDEERKIIEGRYFMDLSQFDIARKLNMSQVKVSRGEKKSKEKIKKYIESV